MSASSGSAVRPVGIIFISPGARVTASLRQAQMSRPALPEVARVGMTAFGSSFLNVIFILYTSVIESAGNAAGGLFAAEGSDRLLSVLVVQEDRSESDIPELTEPVRHTTRRCLPWEA